MKEGFTKRKDLIKNVAIVFLLVLSVLTFFSNSIMNYSLPEVATVYIQPGNITSRVRGSATIEASDPYSVLAAESRTIQSVLVKVGDEVTKGDTIYQLEETESVELKQAESTLVEMELNFMKELFSGTIRSNMINKIDAGNFNTYDELRNSITGVLNGARAAGNNVDELERNVKEMHRRLVSLGVASGGEVALKDVLLINLEDSEKYVVTAVNGILNYYQPGFFLTEVEAIAEIRTQAKLRLLYTGGNISKEQFDASDEAYAQILSGYDKHLKELENAVKVAENNLIIAQQALSDAEDRRERITEHQGDIIGDIQAELKFNNMVAEIDAKKDEIKKLKEKSVGPAVTAPVSGIITSLSHVAGETMQLDNTVAVIQVAGKGFTASFSVTNEQASKVKIGDPAEVVGGWWWGNDINVILTGIRPDSNNPGQRKELIFTVSGGNIQANQAINISVGQRSANYDLTVPNSAIREDSNSKFIMIIEERATPLNNRYYATRVDIEVIAEDETSSAISAPINPYQYVITTATKPVSPGQQIRLTN